MPSAFFTNIFTTVLSGYVNSVSVVYSFIQLDLGLLRITNTATWHGSPEKDPSAVHLDVLDVEVNIFIQSIVFFLWWLCFL